MVLRRKDPGPRSMVRFIGRVIDGSRPSAYPGFIEPSLATLREKPPTQDKYVHEIKFDGYRIQAHLRGGLPALYTRSGLDWSHKFNPVAVALSKIPATDLILDGEIISAAANGHADFSALQDDLSRGRTDRMVYYAFDILFLDGFDLRGAAFVDRKQALSGLLAEGKDISPVVCSEHLEMDGGTIFKRACDMQLEGIVSKLRNSPYKSGRNENWLKVKCAQTGRFEVIGFKVGTGAATSLYLGKREGNDLLYAGKAGTGFTDKMTHNLRKLMDPIILAKSPLAKKPPKKIGRWVAPKYWAEVEYRDITSDGLLRHVSFRGLYPSQKSKQPIVARFGRLARKNDGV